MKLFFTKMQGAGNDYLFVDCRKTGCLPRAAALSAVLSRPHYGVGADGLVCICPPMLPGGDACMRMFNADGTEGTMCGNGVRCVAEYLYTHGLHRAVLKIDTPHAGQRILRRVGAGRWQADMGRFTPFAPAVPGAKPGSAALCTADGCFAVQCLSIGNPHCVVPCPDGLPSAAQLARRGAALAEHPAFLCGANVEFVHPVSPACLTVSVWERGSGATLACGTGACAAAAAMVLQGICRRCTPIEVQLPGGVLTVCISPDDTVQLTGDAVTVFTGEVTV